MRFSFALRRIAAVRFDACAAAMLGVWCFVLFFYGLSVGTLYRTEALRAIIGQAALDGHWSIPMLYGEPFLTKPPGMYVAIGLTSLPFGRVTEVSARIPSALAASVMVLAFFFGLRRTIGSRNAFAVALLLPVSLVWLDKAPSADIDMLLVMWVTLALLCFCRALETPQYATIWWIASLSCAALGFLTKWTAPAFFYVTVIPFLAWRGQLRLLGSWRHGLAALLAALLVAAWACSVAAQIGWEVLIDTVGREARQRFDPAHHGRAYPWKTSLTFPFIVMGSLLPWSLSALWTLRRSVYEQWDEKSRRFMQLCHCWTWPNLLFWSLPGQHAVRYALPIAPGLIALGIMGFLSMPRLRRPAALAGIVAVWLIVKIVFVEVVLPTRTERTSVRETAQALSALVPEGRILYLCKLKDEGVLFYYARPAQRFDASHPPEVPFYAVLLEQEWNERDRFGTVETQNWFRDQQGAAFVLVKVEPYAKFDENAFTGRD